MFRDSSWRWKRLKGAVDTERKLLSRPFGARKAVEKCWSKDIEVIFRRTCFEIRVGAGKDSKEQ
jgi:hypothetical protein